MLLCARDRVGGCEGKVDRDLQVASTLEPRVFPERPCREAPGLGRWGSGGQALIRNPPEGLREHDDLHVPGGGKGRSAPGMAPPDPASAPFRALHCPPPQTSVPRLSLPADGGIAQGWFHPCSTLCRLPAVLRIKFKLLRGPTSSEAFPTAFPTALSSGVLARPSSGGAGVLSAEGTLTHLYPR